MYVRQSAIHLACIQIVWDSPPLFSAIKFTSLKKQQQQGKSVFTFFLELYNKSLFTESTFCIEITSKYLCIHVSSQISFPLWFICNI